MTQGNMTKNIFSYAVPLIIGSLLQNLFNVTDQIVLGQMAGSVAVASVGACHTMVSLVVGFFVGLGAGATVVLARSIGRKDDKRSKEIISTAMISAVVIGVAASLISLPCVSLFLNITKCPADCINGAKIYARIYFLSVPAITVYNFASSALQVTGDSRRPTVYIITAGAVNLVLNVILCFILKNKVIAVAVATVASQLLGAFLTVRRLSVMNESYRLELGKLTFSKEIFKKIIRFGLPSGFNGSLHSIANIQVQSAINTYGYQAIAGHSAAMSIESAVSSVTSGFGITSQTMVGQNLGADNRIRVKKSILYTMAYSVVINSLLGFSLYLLRRPLVHLCVPDPGALEYATLRMQHVLIWCGINAYNTVLLNVLNSFGYSSFIMIGNICSTILFRTFWMQVIYPHFTSFRTIMCCYTIAWCMNAVLYSVAFAVVFSRYKKGKLIKM